MLGILKSLSIYPISSIILDYYSNPVFDKVLKDIVGYENKSEYIPINWNNNHGEMFDIQSINYSICIFSMIILSNGKVIILNVHNDMDPINLEEYYIKCPIKKLTIGNMKKMVISKEND